MFTVAVQLGAILAVVVLYAKKFFDFKRWQFYIKLGAAVVPALVIGFLFSKNKESFEIDSPNPSGLNFRVQVGAFRRPVREDVYREFTPVSGQKLRNGLIVYMAGYFNNSIMAVQAQREIRAMGYSDAFIVAYCNDERLPFWKGKEYERNGNCIADAENSFFVANQNGSSSSSERTLENLVSVNIKSDDSIDSDLNKLENKSDSISLNILINEGGCFIPSFTEKHNP